MKFVQVDGLDDMLACMRAMDLKPSTLEDLVQRLQDMRMACDTGVLPGYAGPPASVTGSEFCGDILSRASSVTAPVVPDDWPALPGHPGVVIARTPLPHRNRFDVLDAVLN